MRALTLCVVALLGLRPVAAQEHALRSEKIAVASAQFGVRERCDTGLLQYPGFTVRLSQKTELFRASGQPPWVIRVFEVLKDGQITIGGDVVFNSEERVNGRRFDVDGKIYVAERYHSTAGLEEGQAVPLTARLADDEIVIWNEATAKSGNVQLAKIWQREKVEPDERYFPQHVYADGVLVPDFLWAPGRPNDGQTRLKPGSLQLEQVTVLGDDRDAHADGVVRRYGRRARIYSGTLNYPDFSVVLVSRTENCRSKSVRYEFKAYAAAGPGVRFSFDTYSMANGCRFTVNGTVYLAEMFSTTAVASPNVSGDQRASITLKSGELIVWNQSTARLENPRLGPAFEKKSPDQPSQYFAGGAPIESGFTGTYFMPPQSGCPYAELDAPLRVLKDVPVNYPIQFSGSGYVGEVHGFLIVDTDGTVTGATTAHGNDISFQAPSAQAIRAMRFTPPTRGGQPTKPRLNFSWTIGEPNCDTSSVRFE